VSIERLPGPFDGLGLTEIGWAIAGVDSGRRRRRCTSAGWATCATAAKPKVMAVCLEWGGGRRPASGAELGGRSWEQLTCPPRAARCCALGRGAEASPAAATRRRSLAGADVVVGDVSLVGGGGGR